MQRIQKALGGHAFALAVFLAVYAGLLAIVLAPREDAPAHFAAATQVPAESALVAAK
jgi:hypothetical protein